MPEITPITPEGTITVTANTQMPSARVTGSPLQQEPTRGDGPRPAASGSEIGEKKAETSENKPETSDKELKARLFLEKTKRQIALERKKIEDERRQLEVEKIQTRKFFEAQDLIAQGKLVEASDKLGITYDQLTQQILNNGQVPVAQVAQKTAEELVDRKLQEHQKRLEAQAKASQQKAYNDSLKQMETEIRHLVDNTDKYPLVKHSASYNDIVKFIESEFHRTGRVIPIEEAVQRWEDDVLEGLQELAKLDKVRTNVFKEQITKPFEERKPNTISQKTFGSVPAPKPQTELERRQRAIEAFYGRLT